MPEQTESRSSRMVKGCCPAD